ncbi:MAG TPA: NAD(P)/FAD-dependent oxidoreductase [Woeseiaceae bacterium]|nr:NAD(P)/FAD-dependent oxidoreductase [Woeseiaceae bacterium]
MQHADVIVVGGGPAGSTCAWKLRQAGMNVLVLDRSEFPRTKLCAGWITPQAVDDLEFNTDEYPHSFLSFDRLELNWRGLRFRKKTVQHSIRRYEFDDYLLKRSGATLKTHKVKRITRAGKRLVVDDLFSCDYLVGAGGTSCPVYRQFFHDRSPRAKDLQIATYEHEFAYDWQDDECKLWFSEDGLPGYAWYVPKGRGYVNVGLGGKADAMKSKSLRLQDHWDRFVRNLEERGLVTGASYDPSGYSYYLRGSVDTVRLDNIFIVGDSVGLASKDLGEGIGPAVRSAILAAEAIVENAEYSLRKVDGYSVPGFLQQRILRKAASL